MWPLICKREDLCELDRGLSSIVVSAITCLEGCGILIGQAKSYSQGQVN